jgi:chlorocatechol 1,2-dioxygenase
LQHATKLYHPQLLEEVYSWRNALANRIETVVAAIIEGIGGALAKHFTFEEYRTGVKYMADAAAAKEIPLQVDVFFNTTIYDIDNCNFGETPSTIEGPYFLENMPVVPNGGMLKLYEEG